MTQDTLLFKVTTPSGEVFEVHTTGETKGFPDGSGVLNRYPIQRNAAIAKYKEKGE